MNVIKNILGKKINRCSGRNMADWKSEEEKKRVMNKWKQLEQAPGNVPLGKEYENQFENKTAEWVGYSQALEDVGLMKTDWRRVPKSGDTSNVYKFKEANKDESKNRRSRNR